MSSAQNDPTLRVTDAALQAEASWCGSLAGKLAGNVAPTSAVTSTLASAAAAAALNAKVTAANANCTARMQATATKLTSAAHSYATNETDAETRMQAVVPTTVI